jgi:hypothetical protein
MQTARCAIANLLLGFALMLSLPRVAWAGVASVDSADFTLDTTDAALGIGGVASADSADFTLDTRNLAAVDIGLRVRDGAATLRIGCEPAGTLTSPLRIQKNGTTYGIILVDPDSPEASHIRIQTHSRTKAWMKLP